VLRGLEPSRHLAIKEAAGNAASIAALLAAAGSTGRTPVQ
jgi:ATP-dependent protease ClpP protease subunit